MLTRTALSRSAALRQRLFRSDHHHWNNENGNNLPFKTTNKRAFAIKYVAICVFASSLPAKINKSIIASSLTNY
ncbi:hypothetical protein CONCODRAFT_7261 [Conidiobolus coronatus NRRL 28638]|uniref:Cytochrome c oxidase subunit 8, mitochondrial n=1 Tax=Conidiobolus coronatus (strain ATCC 28846 / CBS 209.66 / NRRL 28638) TaxID=796925 RepID=A0A137P5E5_CONC2|nr:hypothetical protein CONCODRAFT_7261 [Conidiobolus coronatus NRRL 28638]|eukprot:KXN70227.1 hypothetical protein CONCODRAFT_7261 [Conidiobolus coronatus NRRL 28638]